MIAKKYLAGIHNSHIQLPSVGAQRNHVWHIFAVMCDTRDKLKSYLADHDIGTVCHYPISIADQPAYAEDYLPRLPLATRIAACELSLPLFNGMTDGEIQYVIEVINNYPG